MHWSNFYLFETTFSYSSVCSSHKQKTAWTSRWVKATKKVFYFICLVTQLLGKILTFYWRIYDGFMIKYCTYTKFRLKYLSPENRIEKKPIATKWQLSKVEPFFWIVSLWPILNLHLHGGHVCPPSAILSSVFWTDKNWLSKILDFS